MADQAAPKPTGRRVRGYITDLVELSGQRALWTGIVHHEDYRSDPTLDPSIDRAKNFVEMPMIPGLTGLAAYTTGVYLYKTGEVRCVRELMGAAPDGIGWRAAMELLAQVTRILADTAAADDSLPNHRSLDPHRILVDYDGGVQLIGYGLPRLDLLDFIDDATLLPPTEALRFTAPESLEGAAEDFSTDLFITALITAELATGVAVFPGKDAKTVLAASGDGEGRKVIADWDLPDGVEAVIGPLLEPWPEDRPSSTALAAEAAEALFPKLEGLDLAATMEALGEIASPVEADLPSDWKLPADPFASTEPAAAPAVDPGPYIAEAKSAAERARVAAKSAAASVDKASSRSWSLDADASALHQEARSHADAASRAAAEASQAVTTAQSPEADAEEQAAIASDAADRAQGAAAESKRTLERALAAVQSAEEAHAADEARAAEQAKQKKKLQGRVAALGKTMEVIRGLLSDADTLESALGPRSPGLEAEHDAVTDALQACRAAGSEGEAAKSPDLTDSAVSQAESTVRKAHKTATKALARARSAIQVLDLTQTRVQADKAERTEARAQLQSLAEQARDTAIQASTQIEQWVPAHPDARAIIRALDEARRAASDAASCAEEVERIELEPEDDITVVLDAAQTHFQATQGAAERAASALERAQKANAAETEAAEAADRARVEAATAHRASMKLAGARIDEAVNQATQARSTAQESAGEVATETSVAAALASLVSICEQLTARKANYTEVVDPADSIEDPDELELLLLTVSAEADFAEADASDIPQLLQGVIEAADSARAAIAEAEAARASAYQQIEAAEAQAAEAEATVARLSAEDPVQQAGVEGVAEDPEILSLSRAFTGAVAATGMALHTINEVATRLRADAGVPDAAGVAELQGAAKDAADGANQATKLHSELSAQVATQVAAIKAAAAARTQAIATANNTLEAITAALEKCAVEVPEIADAAVAERVSAEIEALVQALTTVPQAPTEDIEADPAGAVERLQALLPPSKEAAKAVTKASSVLGKAITRATTLVNALRDCNQRAESSADRAATAAASARDLLRGLDGEWPGLEEPQEALRELIAVADQAAAQASSESESVSEATTAKEAGRHATAAEKAAAIADEALAEAAPCATELAALVEQARQKLAEQERAAQAATIAEARELAKALTAHRATLEDAVERAGSVLADSPSAAARLAWSEADPVVDEAMEALQRADTALESTENATTAAAAAKHRDTLAQSVETIAEQVQRAAELADGAIAAATDDAQANAELQDALTELAAQVEQLARSITEQVQDARRVADEAQVDALDPIIANVEQQAEHVRQAAASTAEALAQAPQAPDASARTQLLQSAKAELERAHAASNTAVALQKRIDDALESHREALEKRRGAAQKKANKIRSACTTRMDKLAEKTQATLAEHQGWPELSEAIEALELSVQHAQQAVAQVSTHAEAAAEAQDAPTAEACAEATQAAVQTVDAAIAQIGAATTSLRQARTRAESARAAARQAAAESHAQALVDADSWVSRAEGHAAEARANLESARELLETSPARGAATAWRDATAAVEAAERAAAQAQEARSALPIQPPEPDSLEVLSQALDAVRCAADEARDTAATVSPTLATARQSAIALAGILDEAVAVRQRYEALEKQLNSSRSALAEALVGAEDPRTLQASSEAELQFEELDQTLGEARTSLDELTEATDPDEATALLEVARASLDIARSVFEFAMPTVEHAVGIAQAETAVRREREAAIQAARESIAAAADVPNPAELQTTWAGLLSDAAELSDPAVQDSLDAPAARLDELSALHTALTEAAEAPLSEDPSQAAIQAQQVAALRVQLDKASTETRGLFEATRSAIEAAIQAESERRARIEDALVTIQAAHTRISQLTELAGALLPAIEERAAEWPDATPQLDALRAAISTIRSVRAPSPDNPDDETEVAQAALEAELALDALVGIDLEALGAAVDEAIEQARQAAERERATLALAAKAFAELLPRWRKRVDAGVTARNTADQVALDHPLEAGEALAALDSALGSWPQPILELPTKADAATLATAELRDAVELAEATDLGALLQAVRDRVHAAEAEEVARARALASAARTLAEAQATLHSRQQAGADLLAELDRASQMPEAEQAWSGLSRAVAELQDLSIDIDLPPTDAVAAHIERALQTAAVDVDLELHAEATRSAIAAAEESREAARARIDGAHEMLETEASRLEAALAGDLPDSPPVAAAQNAVQHSLDQLRALSLASAPTAPTPTRALLSIAEEAERALAKALESDLDGLVRELTQAAELARAKQLADAEAREAAAQNAHQGVLDAIGVLESAIAEAGVALDTAPAVPDGRPTAAAHRSAARDALEASRSSLARVQAIERQFTGDLPAERALEVSFEAEAAAEEARAHIATVHTSLEAQVDELARINSSLEPLPGLLDTLDQLARSATATRDDLPAPVGPEAESARGRLDGSVDQAVAALQLANTLGQTIRQATSAAEAEGALGRIEQLIDEVQQHAEAAREAARQVRESSEAQLEREAAARAEAAAADLERAVLAAERAAGALERVSNVLVTASELAEGSDDAETDALITAIAEANNAALQASDEARRAAEEATEAADRTEATQRAVEFADQAEQAVTDATQALEAIRDRKEALRAQVEAAGQRAEAEHLARRDAALPGLRTEVSEMLSSLEGLRAQVGEPHADDDARSAQEKVTAAAQTTEDQIAAVQANLELLENGRWDEVDDFLKGTRDAVGTARMGLTALRAAATSLRVELDAAKTRTQGLELEEHRGRAWEACRVAQQLSARMLSARSALPELPDDPTPDLTKALDRLAQVERRLWRAGQRADEAREKAGTTEHLDEAREQADIAEKAIGAASRWEREMDAALADVTAKVKGFTGIVENPRMAKLRRGRLGPSGEDEAREKLRRDRAERQESVDEPTSRTEALLARLRKGRKSGETGRERLRRLREQRKAENAQASDSAALPGLEPVNLPSRMPPEDAATQAPSGDYGGIADFEDLKPTQVAQPSEPTADASSADRRRLLMERLRRRTGRSDASSSAEAEIEEEEEEGKTQIFTVFKESGTEDAATQMFSREMLDDLAGELEDADEDSD